MSNILVVVISIVFIAMGIAALFGFAPVPKKFKGQPWTKEYIHKTGISDIMLGIPWLMVYFFTRGRCLSIGYAAFLIISSATPSLLYSLYIDKKYKAMLAITKE